MQLTHSYWAWEKPEEVVPEETVKKVVEWGLASKPQQARTKGDEGQTKKEVRDSFITWLEEPWIYDRIIRPYVSNANQSAGWHFDITNFEGIQFTQYALDQHYNWHSDGDSDHPAVYRNGHPNMHGKVRKISISVTLSDPDDYEGGELELLHTNGEHVSRMRLPKGGVCVFPSFVKHRVAPVTSGIRYSLVTWSLGYPFR